MLKGINIGTDTTVKDILDILEGVDPTTRVYTKGTIGIASQESSTKPGHEIIITNKEIGGLITPDAPLGFPFIDKAENEHPLLAGRIMYLNDDSDNLLVIEDVLNGEAALEDGQTYVGIAVQLPRYWGKDTYYTESAILIFIENTDGTRRLIGHITDVDDADATFIDDVQGWEPSGYGIVNLAIREMENPGAVCVELFRTTNVVELLYAAVIYTTEVTDGIHLYVNINGVKNPGTFTVLTEDVTVQDSDGDDVYVTIGIVIENDIVRVVYVDYDEDEEDQLEKVIAMSHIISPCGDGTYACNTQGLLSSELSRDVTFYDGRDATVGLYDTSIIIGAAMAAIDMVEYACLADDEDEDDD